MSRQPPGRAVSLESIQRWMQSVITHPYGITAGIESDEACEAIDVSPSDIETVVTRSRALNSIERLEVYGNAYYGRLLECLRGMFSALVYALGQDAFDEFAFAYLQRYPSTSYSLGFLADDFVRYLEETRPSGEEESAGDPSDDADSSTGDDESGWVDFIIDLARLEWNIDKVFDGPGMEKKDRLTPRDLAGLSPQQWHRARLVPAPCLRVLRFRYPVSQYFADFRANQEPGIPDPEDSFVAISRRQYVVRRYKLSEPEYTLLAALMAGETVGDAIEEVAAQVDDMDELGGLLGYWFQAWGEYAFFERVEVSD